jgi:ketosteroid isomerase-like protein
MKNLSAHVFGDHAIVSMIGELKGTYNGKDVSSSENSVDYFIRRDGRWQMVYTQNTPLKP